MSDAPKYAENTEVPVEQSRAEIEALLRKHGASAFFSAFDDQKGTAMIGFRLADRMFRLEVKQPTAEQAPKRIGGREVRYLDKALAARVVGDWRAQEERRRWRAQLLLIKAKLEMIATGETTVEREFLADMLTPGGQTVGQRIFAQLAEAYATGTDMPLLEPGRLLLNERGVELHHATHRELLTIAADTGGVDAMIVDAPYSRKTHAGHNSGSASAHRPTKANGVRDTGKQRRAIGYDAWTAEDVEAFVDAWVPLVRGWFCSITDDILARTWRSALALHDLQTFAPIPIVETGSTVRLTGDGPSSWTTWLIVARPRTRLMSRWGTLPGAYVVPSERKPVVGGKPIAAMRAIVRDYSREGDRVCDPCSGGGTLGLACISEKRDALLGERDEATAEQAAERLRAMPRLSSTKTLGLFASEAT